MKRTSAFIIILAVSAGTLGMASIAGAQQTGSGEDEAAIRKVIVEMTDAFNSHDEKGLSGIFATRAKNATQRTLDVAVRFIRPDVALANVTNELSGLVAPDGRSLPAHQELSLRVFVKDAGIWQVAAFHNTMVAPFAPAAQSMPTGNR